MKIENLYPGAWGSNCYLLSSDSHAAIVDPSANTDTIVNHLSHKGLTLDYILLTHGHFDHIVSIDTLRDKTGVPVYVHEADLLLPEDAHKNAFYLFFRMERQYRRPEKTLRDRQILRLGEENIRVIHTPGHTAGGVCFLCNDEFLLTGDTLFADSYGRYDLYGGDVTVLFQSLRDLRNFSPDLTIYPGHGESARLGDALDNVLY
ncbi:MAG: MBL fold metallo-hydrolase [Clostridia bacterium]|nr:MBL fold metallo-hydrolase [Clostridia bacterium]